MKIANYIIQNLIYPNDINDDLYESYSKINPLSQPGGDFIYQKMDIHGKYWFAVGDSSGHDLNSHLFSVSILNRLSYYINFQNSPIMVHSDINRDIFNTASKKNIDLNIYATMVLLNLDNNGIGYHYGQHPNLILYKEETNDIEVLQTSGSLIGMDLPEFNGVENQFFMKPGDILFVFTDGLFEQKNKDGKYYGYRLYEYIKNADKKNLKLFTDNLFIEIHSFISKRPTDDMSLLIIRKK